MSSTFDQFTALQNALSELNYSQPLLRESVPLVQAIFSDLVEVTKKYTQVRKQSEITTKELRSQLDPIKNENDKLTKENNTLHLQIIEHKDEFEATMKRMKKENEKYKMQKDEINVLLNQKKHKIKNQEATINNLKKKMNAIISSHGTSHKQLIGKTSSISFNSSLLSPANSVKNGKNLSKYDDEQKEMNEQVNDDKYTLLQNENASLLAQIRELTQICHQDKDKMIDLTSQLKSRKDELDRIHSTLKIDDNRIKFMQYTQEKENEAQKIKHLESQIDVLQNEMLQKEKEGKESVVKDEVINKLRAENDELNTKLDITWKEMDKLKLSLTAIKQNSKALKLEKKFDILKSTKKLSKNVSELTLLQNKIDELVKKNKVLETKLANKSKQHSIVKGKNKDEKASNHTLNVRLEMKEKELDKVRMEQIDLMKICDEAKQRIKDLMHEMAMNENEKTNLQIKLKSAENKLDILSKQNNEMNGKYEQIKQINGANQESNKEMNITNESLRFKIKCLEKENEAMNERLVKILDEKHEFESKDVAKQSENFELVKKLQNVEFKNDDLQKEKEWNSGLLVQCQTKISKLEKDKKELQSNMDRIKKQCDEMQLKYNEIEYKYNAEIKKSDDLEDKLKQSESMICSLKVVKSEFDISEKDKNGLELQLISLKNENDKLTKDNKIKQNDIQRKEAVIDRIDKEKNSLKLILQQIQQRVSAFQQRLNAITCDRDHIKSLYDESVQEMDNRNEQIANLNLKLSDLKIEYAKNQNALKNLQQKHEELSHSLANKENLCRDSSVKINEFSSIQDQMSKNLKQQIDEKQMYQNELRQITKERNQIQDKLHDLQTKYNELKEKVVPSLNQEIIASQLKTGELKVLCNKLDDGHKSAQAKIEELYNKNQELINILNEESNKTTQFGQKFAEKEKECANMKSALQKLVNEHDKLQNELDKAAELQHIAKNELKSEKAQNCEFQSILSETQRQYRQQQKQLMEYAQSLKQRDDLIAKLQKQIIPQLQEANRLKSEQLKNLGQDIENMSKENQFLNNEYAVTMNDRDNKNNQLSTTLNKVLYLESQCKNIENEKNQILENYKSVVLENEKLHKISQLLDGNKNEFTLKIQVLEQHIARRDMRIKHLEKNLSEANVSNHELQRQHQMITRDLERSKLNSSKNQTMSINLQKDLEAMRENVVSKQQGDIDKKTKIIIEFKKENKNLQRIINELSLEKEVALNSLNTAEQKMNKLQEIIGTMRVDSISKNESVMNEKDESHKMKMELDGMKDLNKRLSDRLQRLQTS